MVVGSAMRGGAQSGNSLRFIRGDYVSTRSGMPLARRRRHPHTPSTSEELLDISSSGAPPTGFLPPPLLIINRSAAGPPPPTPLTAERRNQSEVIHGDRVNGSRGALPSVALSIGSVQKAKLPEHLREFHIDEFNDKIV